jgi:hypothetical protein
MRYAFLVAAREFAENVKTKGFWIGIFLFPLMIWLSFSIGSVIERTKSVRHFVVVDRSGELEPSIEAALERLHQREVLQAFGKWVQEHSRERAGGGITAEVLESTPALDPEEAVAKWAGDNPELLDDFLKNGGLAAALAQVRPMLAEDAGEFTEPRRSFKRVPLPEGIAPELAPDELAEALKPYLRGDSKVMVDGERTELFAAVIIPAQRCESASGRRPRRPAPSSKSTSGCRRRAAAADSVPSARRYRTPPGSRCCPYPGPDN